MRSDNIEYIVDGRLNGMTGREIAASVGVSYQYVYSVLAKFPQCRKRESYASAVDKDTAREMCLTYLKALPPSFQDINKSIKKGIIKSQEQAEMLKCKAASAVAAGSGLDEQTVLDVLCGMKSRKRTATRVHCIYPKMDEWIRANSISLMELARCSEIEYDKLKDCLHGKRPFSRHNAEKISKVTGLPIGEFSPKQGDA